MKKRKGSICLWALLLTITLALLFLPSKSVSYIKKDSSAYIASTSTIKTVSTSTKVKNTSNKLPEMPQVLLDISWCESRDDQKKVGYNYRYKIITNADGSTTSKKVLWSKDIGRWQINEYYHAKEAAKLGYDIYTEQGNALYAIVLYNSNGTRDWNASKPCWSDIEAWKAKEQSYY